MITMTKNDGFNMLEVLVALLILSVGLLGVATLQVRGQQFNQVAYLRTQATFLAYDLMDRMRLNFTLAQSGGYKKDFSVNTDCDTSSSCSDGNVCTAEDLRDYDLGQWCMLLKDTLPEGEAKITSCGTNNNSCIYKITLRWVNILDKDENESKEMQQWVF